MLMAVLLPSCSTKKNTAMSRFWQAFNTRYNVYYNGETNYIEQLHTMETDYEDDYTRRVLIHPAEAHAIEKATKPKGSFDRTIEKMQKAIQLHSITKKPKKKEKDQPKQMPTEGVEALVDGDVEKAEEVGVDPMAIPDYFNNIRNNYFVANRIIWLTDDIEWPIVTDVLKRLAFADDKTGDPIWLFIGSCGGLCDAGMALVDMIERLKKKKVVVNTVCVGSCSSMAAVILASGTKGHRYAYPSSRIMIHQARMMMAGGSYDEMQNEANELRYWTETIAKSFVKVSGKPLKEIEKAMSYDNYMSAQDAKKFGLVDKVEAVIP